MAHSPAPDTTDARWPTGVLTLAGLLIGALGGLALYELPVGMAVGLAVGVGLDSLLNRRLNPPTPDPENEA